MKKETWKTLIQILVSILTAVGTTLGETLIQILVSILTAVGTTLGVTSCMGYGPML